MIVRIFVARVLPGHHAEFERKFREISLPLVRAQRGLVAMVIGRPLPSSPDDFVAISTWKDEDALRAFAGPDWRRAVIPAGMEQHMRESWVHHYEVIE